MAKISQKIAQEVADKITQPLKDKIKEHQDQMGEKLAELLEARIPADIKKAIKAHPNWFSGLNRNRYILYGNGFNRVEVYLPREVYYIEKYSSTVQPTNKEAEELTKIYILVEKAQDKYKETNEQIFSTLLSLGTSKQVEEKFPEAFPYLPEGQTKAIAVVPRKVRETVKCLISEDKKCVDKI